MSLDQGKDEIFFLFLTHLFWAALDLHAVCGLSLVVASRDYSLVAVHGLLRAVASLVAEHSLECAVSAAVAYRLSCPAACGIFPDQRLNPCLLHWQADSQPLDHQGSPGFFLS